ncbi:M20/M25/M40 family metallo-hydrolase [Desulfoluna sp.]|uniref:M20/M25/M40 family metallo-hydrolase n=1 Tax=Desulfoluna sp. TaxID=2045199 RepID=UPI002605626D|nr:M20/M25/M40 family metallo-hydrolase [Desulfoluna sp.]
MTNLVSAKAELFFSHLRALVAIPSVFTRPDDVDKAMRYCRKTLETHLPGFTLYEDPGRNLLAIPHTLNLKKPLLYLSAHVDTVDAHQDEWDAPFSPFVPYESEDELVGRGVSDCKAGVAFQLFLAELAGAGDMEFENLIFSLSFKEEGAGHKSAVHIGRALGKSLPVSEAETLLLVLENTVSTGASPSLGLYTAERGNFVIEVSGPLTELQQTLTQLQSWNPICIYPETSPPLWSEVITQKGGHACSIPREKNRLTEIILSADGTDLLSAGQPDSFGVIPTEIKRGKAARPLSHALILSNRSFDSLTEVQKQLAGIRYRELKEFRISPGMDMRSRWEGSPFQKALATMTPPPLAITIEHNTGISDASTILNTMEPKLAARFFPVVMGPGTRSQRHTRPQRLTHGKNETFDKKSGMAAATTLFALLKELGFIQLK